MEDAAPPRARLLHQSLPCAGLGAHRDGRLRLPSLPGCSYPLHSARARWPSGGARRTPAGFPGLDNLGGTSGERDARVGVCVCVCLSVSLSVCQPVDRRKAESAYSSPSTWPDSAAGAPWRAVLGFTRAHLGPAAFAQPPTQTSASHSLQGTFPSPSSHLPSLSSSLVSRESEEGVTLHKPPL